MKNRFERWTHKGALIALALSVSVLSGCEGMLDVTLPTQLTDEVFETPTSAAVIVNSFIALYEDAWSFEHYDNQGREAEEG